jgi:hypothetical protein
MSTLYNSALSCHSDFVINSIQFNKWKTILSTGKSLMSVIIFLWISIDRYFVYRSPTLPISSANAALILFRGSWRGKMGTGTCMPGFGLAWKWDLHGVTGTRNDRHKNGNAWENHAYTIIKTVVVGPKWNIFKKSYWTTFDRARACLKMFWKIAFCHLTKSLLLRYVKQFSIYIERHLIENLSKKSSKTASDFFRVSDLLTRQLHPHASILAVLHASKSI